MGRGDNEKGKGRTGVKAFLRLVCGGCMRNLADISYSEANPDFTPDNLVVTPRPNVKQSDFRPWPSNPDADPRDRTYSWQCRCGRTPAVKHDRIHAAWKSAQRLDTPGVHVVIING